MSSLAVSYYSLTELQAWLQTLSGQTELACKMTCYKFCHCSPVIVWQIQLTLQKVFTKTVIIKLKVSYYQLNCNSGFSSTIIWLIGIIVSINQIVSVRQTFNN